MKTLASIIGGLAGAAALTLIHQTVKKVDPDAPRMDLLGMEALSMGLKHAGQPVPPENKLYNWTLIGDLISNALYFTLVGVGKKKNSWYRGAALGTAAGLGAVFLPKPLGLNTTYSSRTAKTSFMTFALYLAGGLVSAGVFKLVAKKRR